MEKLGENNDIFKKRTIVTSLFKNNYFSELHRATLQLLENVNAVEEDFVTGEQEKIVFIS